MQERRRAPRANVPYQLDVHDKKSRLLGSLIDLSMTGMRMVCPVEIDLTAVNRIIVQLPKWMGFGDTLDMKGRFVWQKPAEDGVYEVGFAFDPLSKHASGMLELVIQIISAAEGDPARI